MDDVPLSCIDFWCKAGSSAESSGEEGYAHFLEHLIFKGSKNLKEGEFDRRIESLGGSSNAATGFDDVHFYVQVPSTEIKPAINLLSELVLQPEINSNAFSLEREVVLEEIAQYNDQPEERIFQDLFHECMPRSAYGRPILGNEKSLRNANPQKIKSFHRRNFVGENCAFSIAGNIPNDIQTFISSSQLASLKTLSKEEKRKLDLPYFSKGRKEIVVPRLESSRLIMAWPIPPAKEQKLLIGADIANSILSEGRRSRLVSRLREELMIVDSIEVDITTLERSGIIILEASCSKRNINLVETEISKILSSLKEVPIQSKELKRAHQIVKNSFCFGLELSSQVAGISGSQALWGRHQSLLYPISHISYWNAERLQEELFSLIQPENSYTLIAHPN